MIPLIFLFRILAASSSTANTNSNGENGPQSYRFYRAVTASVYPVDCPYFEITLALFTVQGNSVLFISKHVFEELRIGRHDKAAKADVPSPCLQLFPPLTMAAINACFRQCAKSVPYFLHR